MLSSSLLREASFKWPKYWEWVTVECSVLNRMSTSMLPRDREYCERGQKGLKSQMVGRNAPKDVFCTQNSLWTPEPTEAVVTCTRLGQWPFRHQRQKDSRIPEPHGGNASSVVLLGEKQSFSSVVEPPWVAHNPVNNHAHAKDLKIELERWLSA